MRKVLMSLLVLLLGLSLAIVARRLPATLASLETFLVTRVELEGARHLGREEAVAAAQIPAGASVWDDPATWEAALATHPLVRSARVRRRLPGTLVLVVEEKEPVALLATPTLAPVDEEGLPLPLDPARHPLDLPLLSAEPDDAAEVRVLSGEVARLGRVEPSFLAGLSEVALDEEGALVARWGNLPVTFRFRPEVPPRRLREGVLALEDATERARGKPPAVVDLRWADQVVVTPP